MIFVQVFLTAFSAANLSFAIYRLTSHVKRDGCRKRLPQACLELIIAGNISNIFIYISSSTNIRFTVRLLYVSVDPFFSRSIYPLPLQHVLRTLSHPFSLGATILVTFYWYV